MENITDVNEFQETSKVQRTSNLVMQIPETAEKPEHHKATASIYIEGLSILCPNLENQTTEIAFIKEDHTPVEIKVYKNRCQPFWRYSGKKDEKVKIEIQKTTPKSIGKLYRDSKNYDEDFGWMPDLNSSDWHPNAEITIKDGAKDHLSAKLILKDAFFYTLLKSEHNGLQSWGDGKPFSIGRIGRILGADIECEDEDTDVTIRIEGSNGTIDGTTLRKDAGPFFISVVTKPESEASHLHHLYHQIIELNPSQISYEFWYEKEEKEWYLCEKPGPRFTTFACQTFPGGDGPLPEFP